MTYYPNLVAESFDLANRNGDLYPPASFIGNIVKFDTAAKQTAERTSQTQTVGLELFKLSEQLQPDVITRDREMPEIDGLESLRPRNRETPWKQIRCNPQSLNRLEVDSMRYP